MQGLPSKQGLYDPVNEHDACGIGFVVNINGDRSHDCERCAQECARHIVKGTGWRSFNGVTNAPSISFSNLTAGYIPY